MINIKLHLEFCDGGPRAPSDCPGAGNSPKSMLPTQPGVGPASTSGWTGAQGLCVRLSLCNKQLSTRRLTEHVYSLTDSEGQEPGRSLRGPLPRVSQAAVKMLARFHPFLKLMVPMLV